MAKVRLVSPLKDGTPAAQIFRGSMALTKKLPLADFSDQVRARLAGGQAGDEIECEEQKVPNARDLKIAPTATLPPVRVGARSQGSQPTTASADQGRPVGPPGAPAGQRHTIDGYRANGDEVLVRPGYTDRQGRNHDSVKTEKLGVTDVLLALRPGAVLTSERNTFTFFEYARDVQHALGPIPDVNRNPYNFCAFGAGTAGAQAKSGARQDDGPVSADDPVGQATHERFHPERLTGRLRVQYTARSPVFVPSGSLEKSAQEPQNFFSCWDGTKEAYALPGSTVKGATRALFEALTASRTGIVDTTALDRPPLYRRRASKLFVIISMPTARTPGRVEECFFAFVDATGRLARPEDNRGNLDFSRPHTTIDWRANLFHVDAAEYDHGPKKKLCYAPKGIQFDLPQSAVDAYKGMQGHSHFERHPENVANNPANSKYRGAVPPYDKQEAAIFSLRPGDLVFGILGGSSVACFGKNVNFLWPGSQSALDLIGRFRPRKEDRQQLKDADSAEATYGFAGKWTTNSHPFKGRVSFTPFWCTTHSPADLPPAVQLMPLTSPSGTKGKARPLYLEAPDLQPSADYSEPKAALKGRKFYWHQRPDPANVCQGIPSQHVLSALAIHGGPEVPVAMRPRAIRPLPPEAKFSGEVHFVNLTPAELGALITALAPGVAFKRDHTDSRVFGIKVGKAKPRGLGSLELTGLDVHVLDVWQAYGHLRRAAADAPADEAKCTPEDLLNGGEAPIHYVETYKRWIAGASRDEALTLVDSKWRGLSFVGDLECLLEIPKAPRVYVYPPAYRMYAWMPEFDEPAGDPKGGRSRRPAAMRRARYLAPKP